MNDSAVRPCASPSPARSGSWRPRWIPRGAPFKNIDFGSYKLSLDFSRFLTHLVLWNSTGGHGPEEVDPTLIVDLLLLLRYPYKTSKNEQIHSVAMCPSLAGAKWVVASPLDPTRPPLQKH